MKFTDDKGLPIALIEYHRHGKLWMPHWVLTTKPDGRCYCQVYDFDWSDSYSTLYYHNSGSGVGPYINGWPNAKRARAKLWWDQSAAPVLKSGGGEILTAEDVAKQGFALIAEPLVLGNGETNPFIYGSHGEVIYCTKCRDHLPEDNPCEHVFWCERCGEWGGAEGNTDCRHRKLAS